MNDFTKEELLLLHEAMIWWLSNACLGIKENPKQLNKKIKSMIDNYCEHDYRIVTDSDHLKCVKCNKYFSVNGIH